MKNTARASRSQRLADAVHEAEARTSAHLLRSRSQGKDREAIAAAQLRVAAHWKRSVREGIRWYTPRPDSTVIPHSPAEAERLAAEGEGSVEDHEVLIPSEDRLVGRLRGRRVIPHRRDFVRRAGEPRPPPLDDRLRPVWRAAVHRHRFREIEASEEDPWWSPSRSSDEVREVLAVAAIVSAAFVSPGAAADELSRAVSGRRLRDAPPDQVSADALAPLPTPGPGPLADLLAADVLDEIEALCNAGVLSNMQQAVLAADLFGVRKTDAWPASDDAVYYHRHEYRRRLREAGIDMPS